MKHVSLKDSVIEELHLSYQDHESYLRNITDYSLKNGVAMTVAAYMKGAEPLCPSIRLASSRKLNDETIARICDLLEEGYEKCKP